MQSGAVQLTNRDRKAIARSPPRNILEIAGLDQGGSFDDTSSNYPKDKASSMMGLLTSKDLSRSVNKVTYK